LDDSQLLRGERGCGAQLLPADVVLALLRWIYDSGHPNVNSRATIDSRGDFDTSTDHVRPLLHADQPQPLPAGPDDVQIETASVIGDGQLDVPIEPNQGYVEAARFAVNSAVAQRFLRDAEQAQGHVGWNRSKIAGDVEPDLYVVSFFDLQAMCLQRTGQPDQP
jgi:hypothetical protein